MKLLTALEVLDLPQTPLQFWNKNKIKYLKQLDAMINRNTDYSKEQLIKELSNMIASDYFVIKDCIEAGLSFYDEELANHYGRKEGHYFKLFHSSFTNHDEEDAILFNNLLAGRRMTWKVNIP